MALAGGRPFVHRGGGGWRRWRPGDTHHGQLLDVVAEPALSQGPADVFKGLWVVDQVCFLHQLFESLRHGFGALHVYLMAEPAREAIELAELLVCVDEDVVCQEVEAVHRLNDGIQVGCLQSEDLAQLCKLREADKPAEQDLASFQSGEEAFMG